MLTYRYYLRTIEFSLKSPKTPFLAVRAHILTFRKKKSTSDFFDDELKTGLGFKIRQSEQICQRRPTLQSWPIQLYVGQFIILTASSYYSEDT